MTLLYLASSLCGHDHVELINSVERRREASGLLLKATADVGDDAVEDDIRVLGDWAEVLRQTSEERHLLGTVRRVA